MRVNLFKSRRQGIPTAPDKGSSNREFKILIAALAMTVITGCASGLSFRLAEQCDYDRITQAECLERNARSEGAYRSDIERILDEP